MIRKQLATALLVGVLLSACGETNSPLAPEATPQSGLLSGLLSNTLSLVQRVAPLKSETSVTATVGAEGGILRGGGVTLSIPPGALSEPVQITMTVPAGNFYEARFAPHGLQFDRPAVLTFELDLLSTLLDSKLRGAYFEGDLDGEYNTPETFPARLFGSSLAFPIQHFSGYCVVTGRSER